MKKVVLTVQVNADGMLAVNIPLAPEDANKPVRLTVEPLATPVPETRESWLEFLNEVGGSIPDPAFVRHPQGEYEERDWDK